MSAVIEVDDVWKKYRLGIIGTGTLRHDFERWWHRVRGKPDPLSKVDQRSETRNRKSELAANVDHRISGVSASLGDDEVWALRGVSFEVKQGKILGIIGRNGAGKSTLLKILSRVTAPTSGEVRVKGRIASVLEVGTGFHPELTGRENVFLNGAILGMTKAETRKKFDEIVGFAGVERYIDTPVKRYSSGMYVRLAFAVAAHLEPEILIVDEVLAVGDAQFQKKCLGKMSQVAANEGRTVLFVSHNMIAVQSLCSRAFMLAGGKLLTNGPVSAVVTHYLRDAHFDTREQRWNEPQSAPGNDLLRVKQVRVLPDGDEPYGPLTMHTPLRIETEYWILKTGVIGHMTYHLMNDQGITVLTTWSSPTIQSLGAYRAIWRLPASLLNSGAYYLKLLLVQNENQVTYENDNMVSFTIVDTSERGHAFMGREPGVIQPPLHWEIKRLGEPDQMGSSIGPAEVLNSDLNTQ